MKNRHGSAVLGIALGGIGLGMALSFVTLLLVGENPAESSEEPQVVFVKRSEGDLVGVVDFSVVDGDTVAVRVSRWREGGTELTQLRTRLWGVDAPELDQPGGATARAWLDEHLAGSREVYAEFLERGPWGREIVRLTACRDVGADLIGAGQAWHWALYTGGEEQAEVYRAAELAAAEQEAGIWKGTPIPPWDWRKGRR